ncbi:hypothetical protein BX666DRAFT_1963246, partial [Dichotomocladium elegans]
MDHFPFHPNETMTTAFPLHHHPQDPAKLMDQHQHRQQPFLYHGLYMTSTTATTAATLTYAHPAPQQQQQHYHLSSAGGLFGSSDSVISPSSPSPSPLSHNPPEPPMLVASSSSSTTSSLRTPHHPLIPEPFCPGAEFLQYSKETFEQQQQPVCDENKASADTESAPEDGTARTSTSTRTRGGEDQDSQSKTTTTTTAELRRQIHIQSEQKRRAQIKDGFEDLRNELPACLNKKMSKVALLHRTVQHIQHLKATQMTILAELERLAR